jgi:SAM-dependent methyltransferase
VETWQKAGLGLGIAASLYFLWDGINVLGKKQEAFTLATSLVTDKGILNLGAGPHRLPPSQAVARSPQVVGNVDIVPDGLPHYQWWNLEDVPYPWSDHQFDAVFASHVLEHLSNWQAALEEMRRVADWVVLVLPNPASLSGHLHPDHKQHFTFADLSYLQKLSGVIVYW